MDEILIDIKDIAVTGEENAVFNLDERRLDTKAFRDFYSSFGMFVRTDNLSDNRFIKIMLDTVAALLQQSREEKRISQIPAQVLQELILPLPAIPLKIAADKKDHWQEYERDGFAYQRAKAEGSHVVMSNFSDYNGPKELKEYIELVVRPILPVCVEWIKQNLDEPEKRFDAIELIGRICALEDCGIRLPKDFGQEWDHLLTVSYKVANELVPQSTEVTYNDFDFFLRHVILELSGKQHLLPPVVTKQIHQILTRNIKEELKEKADEILELAEDSEHDVNRKVVDQLIPSQVLEQLYTVYLRAGSLDINKALIARSLMRKPQQDIDPDLKHQLVQNATMFGQKFAHTWPAYETNETASNEQGSFGLLEDLVVLACNHATTIEEVFAVLDRCKEGQRGTGKRRGVNPNDMGYYWPSVVLKDNQQLENQFLAILDRLSHEGHFYGLNIRPNFSNVLTIRNLFALLKGGTAEEIEASAMVHLPALLYRLSHATDGVKEVDQEGEQYANSWAAEQLVYAYYENPQIHKILLSDEMTMYGIPVRYWLIRSLVGRSRWRSKTFQNVQRNYVQTLAQELLLFGYNLFTELETAYSLFKTSLNMPKEANVDMMESLRILHEEQSGKSSAGQPSSQSIWTALLQ